MEKINLNKLRKIRENKKAKSDITKNPWFFVSIIAVILVIVLLYIVLKPESSFIKSFDNQDQTNEIPQQNQLRQVSEDNDAVLGDENAPITIVEFSDFQCPYCSKFYYNTLPKLKKEYIDPGKAKLVYRDFPLTRIHAMAVSASEAAECVREQGGDSSYFNFHDKIFENQQSLSRDNLIKWAEDLGYDIENCLTTSKYRNEVLKDLKDGIDKGVQGTPTFFINGKKLVGAQPFSAFKQVIEQELN
jgi:protein-disulfide isomerase